MKHKYSVISRKIKLVHSKEKHMVDKIYNFEKLTPNKEADISVYEEAIDFVFDNADVTNIAISGSYGAGKSSVIESYEKKHKDINLKIMHGFVPNNCLHLFALKIASVLLILISGISTHFFGTF